MWCKDASTSGDCLTRRIESACGGSRDRNRWSAYRRALSQVFLLRRVIELPRAFVSQNVHSLTATTFGDRLSPRARAHYHKSQINTVGSNDNSFLIRLWWNLNYNTRGLPKVPNFRCSFISDTAILTITRPRVDLKYWVLPTLDLIWLIFYSFVV